MKSKQIVFALLSILTFAASCKQEELAHYNAEDSIVFEGIQINKSDPYTPRDTGDFSFGYVSDLIRDSLYNIPVLVTGGIKNYDRPYSITFANTSTLKEGVHYLLLNKSFSIKPGQVSDTIRLRLLRNPELKKKKLELQLQLTSNEHFKINMLDQLTGSGANERLHNFTKHLLRVDDIASTPWFWDPKKNPMASSFMGFLGNFSAKKFQIMTGRFNWDINIVTAENYQPSPLLIIAWGSSMKSYLDQMEVNGTPVLEDDGTPMKMGEYLQ
ncbi:MAG: DUF4843 domain-containing protein [Sphingobacterium sp.]|jgi:hypothetical protein|uniref:DUF4843 domain-containing protein n=1 Tax=Sphingobacterium sp. TaxID=341027 RepID=UPI0028467EAF|nr:DUF4843 domain-containing protein [Sphingobacterium sp.]MDR3006575.1 DUF4843 domain-containing protein [Sphingobacterium sp.]